MRSLFVYLFIGFLWANAFCPGHTQASHHHSEDQAALYLCQNPLAQKAPCCVFRHGPEQVSLHEGMLPSEFHFKNKALSFDQPFLDLSESTRSPFKLGMITPGFLHTIRTAVKRE